MRRLAAGVPLMMLLAACAVGDAGAAPADPTIVLQTTTTTLGATTSTAVTETIPAEDLTEFAVFLVAVDDGLAGTAYAGTAYDEPETFISTAFLFCDLLDAGLSAEEVLTAYASALSAQADDGVVLPEDMLLGGVVLGAGVRVICPQYLEGLNL